MISKLKYLENFQGNKDIAYKNKTKHKKHKQNLDMLCYISHFSAIYISNVIIFFYFVDWSPILPAMAKQIIIYQVRTARLPIVAFIVSTSAWLLYWAVPIQLQAHWTVNKKVLWFILCDGDLDICAS